MLNFFLTAWLSCWLERWWDEWFVGWLSSSWDLRSRISVIPALSASNSVLNLSSSWSSLLKYLSTKSYIWVARVNFSSASSRTFLYSFLILWKSNSRISGRDRFAFKKNCFTSSSKWSIESAKQQITWPIDHDKPWSLVTWSRVNDTHCELGDPFLVSPWIDLSAPEADVQSLYWS